MNRIETSVGDENSRVRGVGSDMRFTQVLFRFKIFEQLWTVSFEVQPCD